MTVPRRIALTVLLVEGSLVVAGAVWEIAQRIRDNHRDHRKKD